ncbi:hypothetical protein AUJ59_01410 [Candidatus Beckwithbacteria bacterium CG1_02_47_37]|uniref:Uncharacterized protein n=1 Tax=Candidatus Beckwithbacteria bacterium CG1_02_47_37 TaxID=1805034 RepID=A0A1J4RSX9_9BACT|nr:MAG: hypothetical protein AUJ59_01410 [Candidatus Beckwithbacteria bacterium CG1_02_47_37]
MWQGVIIEESLKDKSLLDLVKIIKSIESTLESETDKGTFHFHSYELNDKNLDEFIRRAKEVIKSGFYLHLVRNNTMIIILSDKVFKVHRGNPDEFKAIWDFAIQMGIHRDQLPTEHLLDYPFD